MKISKTGKAKRKLSTNVEKPIENEVIQVRDFRDLENSLTDWNAEQNQSGRNK
jgi:hypothetical protein